ncbi:hypothetical protein NPIL_263571 [Nephila pilipes]|uniref:Uncharacterized protein n=1 Tax=Nephila pilipes TaxID=299642 RepID=A0A8X6NIL2_NEPPI|nr:hypothetical protein NPIL_263571 [Nephila pilipes]
MEQDSNPDRSKYENFHNQFNIESIVQMMDNAYTAEAMTRVINVADATLPALFKYPFEDDEKQRKNIKDLEDIIDESRNKYITARRSDLCAAAAALNDTTQAWGKKIMDDDFTIVKAKKKSSKNNNMEYSAKKQKIDEATPCHNKFDRLTIEDVPTSSGNEMDVSPPSPTARKNSTPPQSPRRRTPQQHSTRPSTSIPAPGAKRTPSFLTPPPTHDPFSLSYPTLTATPLSFHSPYISLTPSPYTLHSSPPIRLRIEASESRKRAVAHIPLPYHSYFPHPILYYPFDRDLFLKSHHLC